MYKTALVLEGGGLRGIFTSGVIDCLLDNEIVFDYVIGVSAGACNTIAYIAKEKKYVKKCMIQPNPFDSFYGLPQMVESRRIIDLDKIFYEYTKQYNFPFDRFVDSPISWEMVVSNLRTGKADYLHSKDIERVKLIGKASCSLPIITSPVEIDGELYLDGGVTDSIPIQRALDLGYERILVVLTRKKGNFSTTNEATKTIMNRLYSEYPEFIQAAYNRGEMYKSEVEICEKLESENKAMIIRPTIQEVSRLETSENELSLSYYHGYTKAKEHIEDLKEWFK